MTTRIYRFLILKIELKQKGTIPNENPIDLLMSPNLFYIKDFKPIGSS